MSIRLMITDDHAMFREGLKSLLEKYDDMEVVAEADDGEICLEKLKVTEIDVLLLDILMPKRDGLDVLAELQMQNSNTKVLVLTAHEEYLVKAVELGASGYVSKESSIFELNQAIHTVTQGQSYIPPELLPLLEAKQLERGEASDRIETLTRRELEVLKLLAVGMYNKEIAENLHISERTVKNHVSNIFKKLEVADRTQAAVFAIRNNLIRL